MSSLSGQYIDEYFRDLLQVSNTGSGVDATLRDLSDGAGTSSALQLSTTNVNINGIFAIGSKAITLGGALTTSGAYACTLTLTAATNVTLPTTGTIATLAGSEALSNKTIAAPVLSGSVTGTYTLAGTPTITAPTITGAAITTSTYNGMTLTATTGTLTLTNAKTLSCANTLALAGTDGTTITFQGTDTYVGRTTTDTLTNKTLTTPKIGTSLLDTNGNTALALPAGASAANYLSIGNSSGNAVTISTAGTGSDLDIWFQNKGAGYYRFMGTSTNAARLLMYEDTDNGTDAIIITAPQSITTTRTINLPDADGTVALDSATTGAWTSFTPAFTGFSAAPTGVTAKYKKIGNTCFINVLMTPGTSNTTAFTVTGLPFTAATQTYLKLPNCTNNSAATEVASASISGTTLTCFLSSNATGWTAAGTKGFNGQFFYETT